MQWNSLIKRSVRITRKILLCITLLALVFLAKPIWHLSLAYFADKDESPEPVEGIVNDASRLNPTPMQQCSPDKSSFTGELRNLLAKAQQQNLIISISGARHSMGGHTLYPGGIALNMSNYNHMQMLDHNTLEVGAGALWSEVIPFLDERGLSVSIMQSNNSFSVGGSISVNCHGWQWNKPPIASSVESFSIMLADGSIRQCSRKQNQELFSSALGGYGLMGIILDVRLTVVENTQLKRHQDIVNSSSCEQSFATFFQDDTELGYGRMSINKDLLGDKIIWNKYTSIGPASTPIKNRGTIALKRAVFRGSVGSDYGKKLRWQAECKIQPWIEAESVSRNHLLSESATLYENRTANSTDILHEYFIPINQAEEFVKVAKEHLRNSNTDLLNITIRFIKKDSDTLLNYATDDMLSFVLLFCQSMEEEAEKEMIELSQNLINLALSNNGNYYLTYRLHATPEQFKKAYPNHTKFCQLKNKYDPNSIFQNKFYLKYLKN